MNKSKLGYKKNSPYVNEPNITIDSNIITTENMAFPIMAKGNGGETKVLYPNTGDYVFPASTKVKETPMKNKLKIKYQKGGTSKPVNSSDEYSILSQYLPTLTPEEQEKFIQSYQSMNDEEKTQVLFKCGGMTGKKYQEGGVPKAFANAEVEGEETGLTPDGDLLEFEGKKHKDGGIPVNLEAGTMIFSEHLKAPKEIIFQVTGNNKSKQMSFADLSKKFKTEKHYETLKDPNSDEFEINSAKVSLQKNLAMLETIFFAQEAMKDKKAAKNQTKQANPVFQAGGDMPNIQHAGSFQFDSNKITPVVGMLNSFQATDLVGGKHIVQRKDDGSYNYVKPIMTNATDANGDLMYMGDGSSKSKPKLFFREKKQGGLIQFQDGGERYSHDYGETPPVFDMQDAINFLQVPAGNKPTKDYFKESVQQDPKQVPENTVQIQNPPRHHTYVEPRPFIPGMGEFRPDPVQEPYVLVEPGAAPAPNRSAPGVKRSNLRKQAVVQVSAKNSNTPPAAPETQSRDLIEPFSVLPLPNPFLETKQNVPNIEETLGLKPTPNVTSTNSNSSTASKFDWKNIGINNKLAGTALDIGLALSDNVTVKNPTLYDHQKNPLFNRFYQYDNKEVQRMAQQQIAGIQNSNLPEAVKQAQIAEITAKSQDHQAQVDLNNAQRYDQKQQMDLGKLQNYIDTNRDTRINDIDNYNQRKAKVDYLRSKFMLDRKERIVNSARSYGDYVEKMNVTNELSPYFKLDPITGKISYKPQPKSNLSENLLSEYAQNANNVKSLPNGATAIQIGNFLIVVDKDGKTTTHQIQKG